MVYSSKIPYLGKKKDLSVMIPIIDLKSFIGCARSTGTNYYG